VADRGCCATTYGATRLSKPGALVSHAVDGHHVPVNTAMALLTGGGLAALGGLTSGARRWVTG
jgi:hypothetical protein